MKINFIDKGWNFYYNENLPLVYIVKFEDVRKKKKKLPSIIGESIEGKVLQ